MLKVVIEVVCMLVCRIRGESDSESASFRFLRDIAVKQEAHPKVKTDRVVRLEAVTK